MVTGTWNLLRRVSSPRHFPLEATKMAVRRHRWIAPCLLMVTITVLHFSFDTHEMFWHDLLRRAYYLPILWAVFLYGLTGGMVTSSAVAAVFTIHLITGWGGHLGSQLDQMYDIVGYLGLGFGVGFVVERTRSAARALAQRDWEVSLRRVIAAAVHDLKKPCAAVEDHAQGLIRNSHRDSWEHSIGLRLLAATKRFTDTRQDLAGVARILSTRSFFVEPAAWARHFVADPFLGGRFKSLGVTLDFDQPPPSRWPIPGAILDEVTRCLLQESAADQACNGAGRLVVSGARHSLVIEYSESGDLPFQASGKSYPSGQTDTRLREQLMELILSKFNGIVERSNGQGPPGFRLILRAPSFRPSRAARDISLQSVGLVRLA